MSSVFGRCSGGVESGTGVVSWPWWVCVRTRMSFARSVGSAQRVEGHELRRRDSGGDLVGEELAGQRPEGDAPHAVPTCDVHAGCAGAPDERQAVCGARAGPDEFTAARQVPRERPGSWLVTGASLDGDSGI